MQHIVHDSGKSGRGFLPALAGIYRPRQTLHDYDYTVAVFECARVPLVRARVTRRHCYNNTDTTGVVFDSRAAAAACTAGTRRRKCVGACAAHRKNVLDRNSRGFVDDRKSGVIGERKREKNFRSDVSLAPPTGFSIGRTRRALYYYYFFFFFHSPHYYLWHRVGREPTKRCIHILLL